jgi:hypothetical protein
MAAKAFIECEGDEDKQIDDLAIAIFHFERDQFGREQPGKW